jgi:hypothetical protein
MEIYGQLKVAQLENRTSNGAAVAGAIWFRTDTLRAHLYNGSANIALLANDEKCVFGTAVAAADNVRLHRGATSVLQFVPGNNTDADGTLSTSLAKLSFAFESYLLAGLPSVGNPGRVVYVTDQAKLYFEDGLTWAALGGGGGGGGGGSLQWFEAANSPNKEVTTLGDQVYIYETGLGQSIYALIRVPSGYTAGNQIKLKTTMYCAGTSNQIALRAHTTLIRPGTDNINTTTNVNISTLAAVTLNGGTVNIPQHQVLNLTDGSGQINGVAVSPGHLLRVRLTRETDAVTEDVYVPAFGSEVTFS